MGIDEGFQDRSTGGGGAPSPPPDQLHDLVNSRPRRAWGGRGLGPGGRCHELRAREGPVPCSANAGCHLCSILAKRHTARATTQVTTKTPTMTKPAVLMLNPRTKTRTTAQVLLLAQQAQTSMRR